MIIFARAFAAAITVGPQRTMNNADMASISLTAARSEYSKALRAAAAARDKIFVHAP